MPLLKSADWPLLIDLYFFLGGIAAGAFIVAGVADLWGGARDRAVVRIGSYLALLAIIPCPILLTIDLGMPQWFHHMLWTFKPQSPMNLGSWALLGFGVCSFLMALGIFLEDRGSRALLADLLRRVRQPVGVLGSLFGFFIAAYPGVLLGATARPLWTEGRMLGALFLFVGATTGMAAVALVLALQGGEAGRALAKLRRGYTICLVLQAVALALFLIIVGTGSPAAGQALRLLVAGAYAPTFWNGAVIIGLVVPFALEVREGFLKGYPGRARGLAVIVSLLILIGGFLTKYVIMVAGQA